MLVDENTAEEQVVALRGFNRLVTERIGALHEGYLAGSRPLGHSRVLWEITKSGTEVRALRTKLNLDSGYLSRILRALETEGLIKVVTSKSDPRSRTAQLTKRGSQEQQRLDEASDELVRSLLDPLADKQRSKLIEAATTVERLLTVSLVEISIEDPASDDAVFCINRYFAELDQRFESGFDPSASISADATELREPAGLLLVARLNQEPIGCGALKLHQGEPAEIKRMWVAESARGLGLGRRLLHELEQQAIGRGAGEVHLETNQTLAEAIALYRSAGYAEVEAFNDEPFAHHWFAKRLLAES